MPTKNFKFHIPHSLMQEMVSPEQQDLIMSQLRLANEYRNELLKIVKSAKDRAIEALRAISPEYDDLQNRIKEVGEDKDAQFHQIKEQRKKQRTQTPKGIESMQAEYQRLKELQSELIEKSKSFAAKLRKDEFYVRLAKEIKSERTFQEKQLRKVFTKTRGLYWGTRNHAATSVNKAKYFKYFDGTGSIAMQKQRQKNKPDRRTCDLENRDGWFWVGKLIKTRGTPNRKHGYVEIRECFLRITGDDFGAEVIRFPVTFHRSLPKGVVTWAYLDCEKKANRTVFFLRLTIDITEEQESTNDDWCAIRLGWEMTKDGVQVVVGKGCDKSKFIECLDKDHLSDLSRLDAVKKERSDYFNAILPKLDEYLKNRKDRLPDWVNEFCQYRFNWKSMKKFAVLRRKLFSENGSEEQRLADLITPWVKWDKAKWQHECNVSRRLQNRRNDRYRKYINNLRDKYGIVFVMKQKIKELTGKKKKVEKNERHITESNRQAATAAPSTFVEFLKQSFPNRVVEVSSSHIAVECSKCGHKNKRSKAARTDCQGCGRTYDVSENVLDNIIKRGNAMVKDGELQRLLDDAKNKEAEAENAKLKRQEGARKANKAKKENEGRR